MSNTNGHRWSKFWWHDWDTDRGLRSCSFGAQGLWMRLLCVMHDADPVGYLVVNGRPPSLRQIVDMCGGTAQEVAKLMRELESNGVFSRAMPGKVIYNRRMVRDSALSEAGRQWGKQGGNPILTGKKPKTRPKRDKGGLNPPPYPGGITDEVNHPGYPGALTEGVGPTLKLEADTDSEVESKKEEVSNIIPLKEESLSRARARETDAPSSDPKIASLLRGLGRELRNFELAPGRKPRLDKWDQAKLMQARPGAKCLSPDELALARKQARRA
jgi:hypothetical protein